MVESTVHQPPTKGVFYEAYPKTPSQEACGYEEEVQGVPSSSSTLVFELLGAIEYYIYYYLASIASAYRYVKKLAGLEFIRHTLTSHSIPDLSDLENARYKDETAQEFIDKRREYLQRELRQSQANHDAANIGRACA
ncbi:hypothetical protein FOPE_10844 [Fonsecaea pedrosoi]|nr:hypothetical protein FOPE_10844 [Fonsecaea pedrosoi]